MILSASSTTELPDGWISDFILDKLTITKVKIPESKTNPNSRLYRLSFRDLMKLLYLKQTRVGSESLLDYTNPVVFNKNYEIQKFVYNIHDDRVAEYQAELTQEKAAKNKLDNNLYVVNNFLRSINLNINKDEILNKKLSAEKDLSDIEFAETAFKENFELSSQLSNELSLKILEAKAGLRQSNAALESKKYEIKNYLSLKKTYETDLVNLKTSNSIRSSIDLEKMNPSLNVECPLCKTELKLSNPIILNEHIDSEVRSISNRLQGVSVAVERLLNERYEIEKDLQRQSNDLEKLTTIFDSEHKHVLSPLVTNIQIFERQKSSVSEAINELSKALLIKNKVSDIEKSIENKSALIERLKRDIDSVTEELKGIDDVLDELTEIYKLYLEGSGVQDNYGAYIDKKFTPFFREISYYKTSSGGVRTILSILSFIARMHYLILNGGNLPVFFMLDTPGQNIGRGKRKGENEDEESLDAETSDPALYDKIYKQL
ncbi:MAG TPA: hypothetical protein DCX28_11440, partial [Enterobacteriaceae bacterium]|nr:hypothetical protein [Enterobacteriaceae bacterium]